MSRMDKIQIERAKVIYPRSISILRELHELMPDEALAERAAVTRLIVAVAEETASYCEEEVSRSRESVASAQGAIFPADPANDARSLDDAD
jgi:hypothetical protein